MDKKFTHYLEVRFYSNGKYLPSCDEYFYYDLWDDDSFNDAHMKACWRVNTVCDKNEQITARIITNKYKK